MKTVSCNFRRYMRKITLKQVYWKERERERCRSQGWSSKQVEEKMKKKNKSYNDTTKKFRNHHHRRKFRGFMF